MLNVRFISFFLHIRFRVCFLFAKHLFGTIVILCTRWGAFAPSWGLFSWKALEYELNGKFNERKEDFLMMPTLTNIFELKKKEGNAHEEIKKQTVIYGTQHSHIQRNV